MNRRFPGLLVALFLTAGVTSAQPDRDPRDQDKPPITGGGSDVFRALFDFAGVKPATREDLFEDRNYRDLIVVVLGPPRQFFTDRGVLGSVLHGGGAVLVATDTQWNLSNQLTRTVQFRIDGSTVVADERQTDTYLPRKPSCPFAVPITRKQIKAAPNNSPEFDLFAGLKRVATNTPSFCTLLYAGEAKYPLAHFPDWALFTPGLDGKQEFVGSRPLAVGGSGPDREVKAPYRFLAVADHSVFINQMLVEPGTDNLQFAARVVKFLQEGGSEKRTRCVFIENGNVVDRFDTVNFLFAPPPLPPLPIPSLAGLQDKIVDFGNQMIDKAQESDLPNRLLLGSPDNPETQNRRLRAMLTVALVLGSVWAVIWTLRRVWKARQPTDLPQPPLPGGRATADGPAGIVERRQKELLRRNNLYEPVRDLLREFFESAGAPPDHGVKLPRVTINISVVRRPETLKKALVDLWKIAYGPPSHVSVQRWGTLEPLFVRAQKAFADSKWQFVRVEEEG